MTRIVSGTAGGRSIAVPDSGTRPTTDRTREALFSRLEHAGVVDGASVLDLFAGSGALGLEAASRGAAHVTLVEAARGAADVCRRNVRTLGLDQVYVVADRAERFLTRGATVTAGAGDAEGTGRVPDAWDLVLLDPPYDVDEGALSALLAQLSGRLTPGAIVVVERSRRSPEPAWPAGLVRQGHKRYGEAALWFAEEAEVGAEAPLGRTHGADAADGADAGATGSVEA